MFCLSTRCAFCVLDKSRLCPILCSCGTVSPVFAADHCQLDLSSQPVTAQREIAMVTGDRFDYRNYHTVANCVNPGCRNAEPHPETQVFLRLLNLNHEASFRGNSPLNQQERSLEMWNSWIPTRRGIFSATYTALTWWHDSSLLHQLLQLILAGVMRGSGMVC